MEMPTDEQQWRECADKICGELDFGVLPNSVEISRLSLGYHARVGCVSLAFGDRDHLINWLTLYLENPKPFHEQYAERTRPSHPDMTRPTATGIAAGLGAAANEFQRAFTPPPAPQYPADEPQCEPEGI